MHEARIDMWKNTAGRSQGEILIKASTPATGSERTSHEECRLEGGHFCESAVPDIRKTAEDGGEGEIMKAECLATAHEKGESWPSTRVKKSSSWKAIVENMAYGFMALVSTMFLCKFE